MSIGALVSIFCKKNLAVGDLEKYSYRNDQ
jgi:hypothetical protein